MTSRTAAFKKITIKIDPPSKRSPMSSNIRKILSNMAKKGKIQRNIVSEYLTNLVNIEAKLISSINARKVSERTKELTENDSLSHNSFWKLKKTLNVKKCRLQRVKVIVRSLT